MNFSQSKSLFSSLTVSILTIVSTMGPALASSPTAQLVQVQNSSGQTAGLLYFEGTVNESWKTNELAPKGSSALTNSGLLANSGIQYIFHAATGSMGTFDESTEPTIESVKQSIVASLRLADKVRIPKVAIPLIGGGIFLQRLGISREQLASEIITAAQSVHAKAEVVFVAYTEEEKQVMSSAYKKSQDLASQKSQNASLVQKIIRWLKSLRQQHQETESSFASKSSVVQGSITDFNVHHAPAIINAANMELQFGGGLSGVIGKATQRADQIDQVGHELIQKFYGH